jgi:membrane associated rhomboid family serine protease
MTPTPVGMRCPECAPGPTRVQRASSAISPDTPVLTYIIIGICTALALGAMSGGTSVEGGGLRASPLTEDGALFGPAVADGEVWRLVTSGFLHSGLIHLGFNMLILWQLGTLLEPAIGRLRFGIIYFVSMLCGSFGALLLSPNAFTVGASGAVFGLMAAAVVVLRNRGIDPWASGLPFWIGLNLLITFAVPGISIGGHIGGLIGGGLAALVMFELPDSVRGLPRVLPTLLAAGIGVVAVAGSLAVV